MMFWPCQASNLADPVAESSMFSVYRLLIASIALTIADPYPNEVGLLSRLQNEKNGCNA